MDWSIMARMPERYAAYDQFAWIYNRHWKGRFHPTAIAAMEKVLLPKLAAGARILDLCCGPGWLAHTLSTRGYRVTGIDGSAEMLRYARENALGVEFILDDARSFELPGSYDAVVCVFDSLNHILSIDELASTFGRVFSSLAEGGLFLFDLNVEAGFRANWNGVFGIFEDDHVFVVRNRYEPAAMTAIFEANLFKLEDGVWRHSDFALTQKAHAVQGVLDALNGAGFTAIQTFDYDGASGPKPLDEESRRAFFLCSRPDARACREASLSRQETTKSPLSPQGIERQ